MIPLALALLAASALTLTGRAERGSPGPAEAQSTPSSEGAPTFTRDIAPIVFKHCAECHRQGEAAPFSLLTYDEVRKHARQIAEVTARGYMPPWPPERGYGEFLEQRSLSPAQIEVIQQWVSQGAVEGAAADLPPRPEWPGGWRLGQPDLVVTLPQPYTLPAEGQDVYRNFVFPASVDTMRYVRAVEFRPGNPKVIHHAFINVDETGQSRRLAQKENPPGFDGMELPESAVMPAGQFLGWQPGKASHPVPDGLSWALRPKTDLVLQIHMHPSGKPEIVQPSVGFYFTGHGPTNYPYRLRLVSYELDIPPGEANYVVEQSYVLPVDLTLLQVGPHAHYLGKDLQGYAVLPSGEKKWLIRIKNWDFNWQGDYQYAQPISLPAGTKLVMHYTYDNSTNNVRNPNRPPKRVRHGLNTSDEMAALPFQVLAKNLQEYNALVKDYLDHLVEQLIAFHTARLRENPNDAATHLKLSQFLFHRGKTAEAQEQALSAVRLEPEDDKSHYQLGYLYLVQNRLEEANGEFLIVARLNPSDFQAFGNLGLIALRTGKLQEAKGYFETALRLNPDDTLAQRSLNSLRSVPQQN
jgi:hypothetical protein